MKKKILRKFVKISMKGSKKVLEMIGKKFPK